MPNETNTLPLSVNHVFVDYENVHTVDTAIIGSKTVHLTLLLGSRQTKLDVVLVEKLLHHASTVELIRLESSGRNALDFALTYYLGRAVLADPTGYFHIVSKDQGFNPLIEHLQSKHVRVRRHDDFSTLTLSGDTEPAASTLRATATAAKPQPQYKLQTLAMKERAARVLEHLRKPTTNRPRTKDKLTSHLISHLGKKVTESEVVEIVEMLCQTDHLVIDDKGKVTYHLAQA